MHDNLRMPTSTRRGIPRTGIQTPTCQRRVVRGGGLRINAGEQAPQVRIDHEHGPIEAVQQHRIRRLRPNARLRQQCIPQHRSRQGLQAGVTTGLRPPATKPSQASRLLPLEPRRPNPFGESRLRGCGDDSRVQRGRLAQPGERTLDLLPARLLNQQSANQHLIGRLRGPPVLQRTVGVMQIAEKLLQRQPDVSPNPTSSRRALTSSGVASRPCPARIDLSATSGPKRVRISRLT